MFFLVSFLRAESEVYHAFKSGAQCQICRSMHKKIHNVDSTKIDISRDSLIKECDSMPKSTKGLCQIIATDWYNHIHQTKGIQKACSFACDGISRKIKTLDHISRKSRPRILRPEPLGVLPCEGCTSMVQVALELFPEIASEYSDPDSNPLLEACLKIPMFADRCHLLTQEKVTKVYNYVADNLTPLELCSSYGMC